MNFYHKWEGEFTSLLSRYSLISGFKLATEHYLPILGFSFAPKIDQSFTSFYPKVKNPYHPNVTKVDVSDLVSNQRIIFSYFAETVRATYLIPQIIKRRDEIPLFCVYRELLNIRQLPIHRNSTFSSSTDEPLSGIEITRLRRALNSIFTPVSARIKIIERLRFDSNLNASDVEFIRQNYDYHFHGIQHYFTICDEAQLDLFSERIIFLERNVLVVPDHLKKRFMNYLVKRIDERYAPSSRHAFITIIYQQALTFFEGLSKKDEVYAKLFKEWIQLNYGMMSKTSNLAIQVYDQYVSPLEAALGGYYSHKTFIESMSEEYKRKEAASAPDFEKIFLDLLSPDEKLSLKGKGSLSQYASIAETVLGWENFSIEDPYTIPFNLQEM